MPVQAPGNKTPLIWMLAALALLTLTIYSNTFNSPFLWDERSFIMDNPIVRDLSYYVDPSMSRGTPLEHTLKRRYMGYLSFALNYRVHGFSVAGYHAVNIAVHILATWLVFALGMLIFRSPRLRGTFTDRQAGLAALLGAAMFAAHPLQTEAVTYIFQRLASLCAMFYLLSITAYAGSCQAGRGRSRWALYLVSILAALAAMKTKETAFTLPFALALYELVFNRGALKARLPRLAPFVPMLVIVPLALGPDATSATQTMGNLMTMQGSQDTHTAYQYFSTQPGVLLTYLKMLVLPLGQNLDHDYPISMGLTEPAAAMSALSITALIVLGILGIKKSLSQGHALYGLAGFGITWFFLTISVESSIVPIPMVMDEYRVYLPSAGLFIALSGALAHAASRTTTGRRRALMAICLVCPLVLGATAYKRNNIWSSRITLWQDVVSKSPMKLRGYNNLGNAYSDAGMTSTAVETFEQALAPDISDRATTKQQAELHYNLAGNYARLSRHTEAVTRLRDSIALAPDNADAHNNMGLSLLALGRHDEAVASYMEALRVAPGYPHAYFNLGEAYQAMYASGGNRDKTLLELAAGNYLVYARLRPGYAETYLRLSEVYDSAGKTGQANSARQKYNALTKK